MCFELLLISLLIWRIKIISSLRYRMDTQILVRARCFVAYEDRESARRHKEWKDRGVWLEGFPASPLQLEK